MQLFSVLFVSDTHFQRQTIAARNPVQAHFMAHHLKLMGGYREYFLKEGERIRIPATEPCASSVATHSVHRSPILINKK